MIMTHCVSLNHAATYSCTYHLVRRVECPDTSEFNKLEPHSIPCIPLYILCTHVYPNSTVYPVYPVYPYISCVPIFWGTETVALLDYMVKKKSYLQLKKFFDGQIRENLWNKKRTLFKKQVPEHDKNVK